jgi:hypothetical protein
VLETVREDERQHAIKQAIENVQRELDEMKAGPKRNP